MMIIPIKKILFSLFLINTALLATGCNLKPVDPATLSAKHSYADFDGVAVKVGAVAPDFTLMDGGNTPVSLKNYKNKSPVMLLFYRGDWCPYCVDQLADYQSLLPELKKYNIQLVAISPDNTASIENAQRKFGQSYQFLSDEGLKVTRQYGIGNEKNLPHPALFLIDEKGILLWYYASKDHETRPSAAQVEKIIQNLFKNR